MRRSEDLRKMFSVLHYFVLADTFSEVFMKYEVQSVTFSAVECTPRQRDRAVRIKYTRLLGYDVNYV